MNLLITGALGHIGSYILDNLRQIKNLKKVYFIDSARSNNINVIFNKKYRNIKLKFLYCDLLKKKNLNLIKDKIHNVIHLASITNAEESFKIKKILFENNYGIFKNIVNFCILRKANLIHLSSTSVYGKQSDLVYEDDIFINPQSPYAEEKVLEEKLLKKNNKIKYVTLRLGTISGVSKGMRFHTAVNKFCLNTILKKEIPIWNSAINQYRPYLSLRDAFSTIKFFINNNIFNRETYNVITNNYTVQDILSMIKKNKFKMKVKKVDSPILNQNSYKVSRNKIEKLDIKLSNSIKRDIKHTLSILKGLY